MDLLLAFVIAMVITMALIPPLVKGAARLQVLDAPGSRKVHTQPIPRVGGIAMVVGTVVPLYVWLAMDATLLAYLLAVLVLIGFGAWDDRVSLSPITKLVGQCIAVLIVMLAGHVQVDSVMLAERVILPHWLGFALTFLFLLGLTNAINLSDGLDGLAGGTTLLCCAALALLAQNWGVRFVQTVGFVLMGALTGFLRFNTYPARIFMGDAGSQFLGFSVAVLSILLTQQTASPLSTALPLLLVGLPILDTLTVVILRLSAGRSPFAADRQHFHHRLIALGFDHHEAVILIYGVQCLLLLLAWQLRFESDLLIAGIFLLFALGVSGGVLLLERRGWRWRAPRSAPQSTPLARLRAWLGAPYRLRRWALRTALLCTAVYLLAEARYGTPVSADIGTLALAGFATLALGLWWRRSAFGGLWLTRAALYVAIVMAVYLDRGSVQPPWLLNAAEWLALPLLALATVVAMRLSGDRRFETTPLDLLLIFGALALPNLPGLEHAPRHLGLSVAELVALCYAVEMISTMGTRLQTGLRACALLFFAVIALRAWH